MSRSPWNFQIPVLYGRLKVDTSKTKSKEMLHYNFQLIGKTDYRSDKETCALKYDYYHRASEHTLRLCAKPAYLYERPPLDVTVNVKSNSTGNIIPQITHNCHFDTYGKSLKIFSITEDLIVRLDPEYSRTHTIEFIVELKEVGVRLSADCKWNSYPKSWPSLSKDFAKILDDPRTADIQLLCGDVTIPAHGYILSARSEVFERMLQTDMMDRRAGSIKIPDIEPQVIKEFMRYLYTSSLPEMTVQKALKLYEAGDKYNVPSLVVECGDFLARSLNENNVCEVLVLADKHSDLDLKKRSIHLLCMSPLLNKGLEKLSKKGPERELEAVKFAYDYLNDRANVDIGENSGASTSRQEPPLKKKCMRVRN